VKTIPVKEDIWRRQTCNQANNLRRQAEEKAAKMTENLEGLSPVEIRQILYELRVHQIELEMQNEVALRESEERFRKLFKSHAAVKLVIDPETGIIIDANEAAEQFYGWAIAELKQMRIQQINILPPETVKAEMEKAVSSESARFEFRHRRADSSIRDVEVFSNKIEVAGKGFLYSIVQDITERKLAQESLRESEKELRAMLSEKEVLIKEIHHRVKNNLQIISSMISLQSDFLTDKRLQWVLSDMSNRVRTIALVHERLYQTDDLSRLNIAEYAHRLMQSLWFAFGAATDKVHLNLSMEPVLFPVGTAVLCGLILNELASNAIKHAFPDGRGGIVDVTLEHDPATGAACLRMRDNGVGLPVNFNWRQTNSLGLRLVQMLAKQMCGTVQTGPGSGTVFQINFNVNGIPS
jgi:PAS domain S-box-containing protein